MQVQVKNINSFPYTETFEGDKIVIPAGGSILMDAEKANKFLGTFSPPKRDVNGKDLPEGYKMLRILSEQDWTATPFKEVDKNACVACAYTASGETDLKEHMKTHASAVLKDENAEKELAERRKPGRPPKVHSEQVGA